MSEEEKSEWEFYGWKEDDFDDEEEWQFYKNTHDDPNAPEWVEHGWDLEDFEDEDAWLDFKFSHEPQEDDFVYTPCGRVGEKICVSTVGDLGKYLGEFEDSDEALQFIREQGTKEEYFPNVWWQDDHGGMTLLEEFDYEPDERKRLLKKKRRELKKKLEARKQKDE